MTTTRCYLSSDSSAPTISPATTGSLLAALRACLVGTAGVAYGARPAAGWTVAFTGVNEAAFVNSAPAGGTGCYVHVKDQLTSNFRSVEIRTYASMSDLLTGAAPTNIKIVNRAPANHASNAVTWMIAADELTFYISTEQTSSSTIASLAAGGDINSFQSLDAYRYMAMGGSTIASQNATEVLNTGNSRSGFGNTASDTCASLGRDYTGLGSAAAHGIVGAQISGVNGWIGGDAMPSRPSANSAEEIVMPALCARGTVARGLFRGLYIPIADVRAPPVGAYIGAELAGLPPGNALRLLKHGTASSGSGGGIWVETALSW